MRKDLLTIKELGRVALLKGGWAAEREVSLVSGAACEAALTRAGVDFVSIDASPESVRQLNARDYDRVLNVVHGRGGEDGQIQAVLELAGIPCSGSGVLGSALAMDKLRTKFLWAGAGLPTPLYRQLRSADDGARVVEELGLPLMVKPALEGSSIGMSKVNRAEDMVAAYELAAQYGDVFAEQWIVGKEYTAAILADEALPLIRLETNQDFYDYAAKYERNDTRYHCPCGLDAEAEFALQNLAQQAFDVVDASGWGRVDLMVDEAGKPWLIEINTVPGMTDHSLVPMAAQQAGMDFDELVLRILMTAEEAS